MYFWHLSTFSQNYICETHPCVVCGAGTAEYISPVSINSSSFAGTFCLSSLVKNAVFCLIQQTLLLL